ncbi:F0F1 ATP synthase subunit delta [Spiroplasma endosymbiont of Labia minor]|uniref:F0F1 ATP synthase subunit delta n=1 Tax=Spiroplasma endosymbiont of Labia minor TaxID=3066305 RepID=UPI0030D1C8EF
MILSDNVINNWANALMRIAIKEKKVDKYIEQANVIVDVLKIEQNFVDILSTHDAVVDKHKRIAIIDQTFGKFEFEVYVLNALKILLEQEAFRYVRQIFKKVRKYLAKHRNILYGTVWSTIAIDDKKIKLMEQKITKQMGSEVKLINKLDESIIGGVQIIVGNKVFDGSLKGKLADLKILATHNRGE